MLMQSPCQAAGVEKVRTTIEFGSALLRSVKVDPAEKSNHYTSSNQDPIPQLRKPGQRQ
jgi:hypothetical protein